MHAVTCTVVLVALSLTLTTHAFPNGAPQSVCFFDFLSGRPSLTPNHPAGNASDAPGGYFIDSDLRDTDFFYNGSEQRNYTITLFSTGRPFRGFAIQVCSTGIGFGGCPIFTGDFIEFPPSAQLLNCGDPSTTAGAGATLTHTDNSDKMSVSAVWSPFPGFSGRARIRYTVVREFNLPYYVNLFAADFPPPRPPKPTQPTECPRYPGKKRRKCLKERKQRRKWWRKLWRQWWRRWGY